MSPTNTAQDTILITRFHKQSLYYKYFKIEKSTHI